MHPFEILAEPVRRRLVEVLASGEHTAGELRMVGDHEFQISAAAVSYHLKILRDERFVRVRAEGGSRLYRLDERALVSVGAELGHLLHLWSRRIDWPYNTDPLARARMHRPSRKGLRGPRVKNDIWVNARFDYEMRLKHRRVGDDDPGGPTFGDAADSDDEPDEPDEEPDDEPDVEPGKRSE